MCADYDRGCYFLTITLTFTSTLLIMELGTNFAAKLEPFLLMSKSAKGAAAAKLIQDATSAPGVFVFAELLEMPNIQEVYSMPPHILMGLHFPQARR